MKKTIGKCILAITLVVLAAVLALPLVIPPIAEEIAQRELARFGVHADIRVRMGFCWTSTGPGFSGSVRLKIPDSQWRVDADCTAALFQWHANVKLREAEFTELDVLVRKLLEAYPVNAVSNLAFSGKISFEAHADRTFSMPVPVWSATAKLHRLDADAMSADTPIVIEDLATTVSVSGMADRFDIKPVFPRAKTFAYGDLVLTNFFADVRVSDRHVLVTEARAALCGGTASVFALRLDTETFNTGFTLYLDDIEAGQALTAFRGFRGSASGRLHGKIKMAWSGTRRKVRMREAFLYSIPGENGKLHLTDSSAVTDNLALAGIDEGNRRNVSNALADLDYTVLRLDLNRIADDSATLGIRIEGTATRGSVSAPVVLNVALHGDLEQLINTGLNITGKGKK